MRCPSTVSYCMTTRTCEPWGWGRKNGGGPPALRVSPEVKQPPSPADYTPYRMKVSKSCVPKCFETVYDGYSKHASTTVCCQYDLCNGAGLAAPAALALAFLLLVTLWGLL